MNPRTASPEIVNSDLYAAPAACRGCSEYLGEEAVTDPETGLVTLGIRCKLAEDLRANPALPISDFENRGTLGYQEPICWPEAGLRNRRAVHQNLPARDPFDKATALEVWHAWQAAA